MMTDNTNRSTTLQSLYWILACSFILILFIIDLTVPVGISFGILYLFPIYLGIFVIESNKAPYVLSLSSIFFILIILFTADPTPDYWKAIVNRALSILFIIFGAIQIKIYKSTLNKVALSESTLNAALEGAANSIIMVDNQGMIVFSNNETERLFGYNKSEIKNQSVEILVPKKLRKDHPVFRQNFIEFPKKRAMGDGRELNGVKKDGSEFPIEIGLTPINTATGFYVMASIIDITERKRQEKEKNKMIQNLTQSNQELDDFAYIASHDLKEPLRGLYNNAQFLLEDYRENLEKPAIEKLNRISFLCVRMEKLINDLLYFSRLGRQDLAMQDTNLNEVIDEVSALMQTTMEQENVAVKVIEQLPIIYCDRVRIKEVFNNLITNAIKYNKNTEKIIEIGLSDMHATHYEFYVKDNGIGIAANFHAEVFRIFKRLTNEPENTRGTGVGLTFVKKIIERHGGRIWLESKLNSGTTFLFTLPRKGKR